MMIMTKMQLQKAGNVNTEVCNIHHTIKQQTTWEMNKILIDKSGQCKVGCR